MRFRFTSIVSVLMMLMFFTAQVMATPKEDFDLGVKYYKANKFKQAVVQFEKAKKQGLQTVALYYNLGSSYYKLNEYDKSEYYFKIIRKTPKLKSSAEYSLGLIALKKNQDSRASRWFSSVIKDNSNKQLVALSEKQLSKLNKATKNWSAYTSGRWGYDNNVNVAPAGGLATEESAALLEIYLSADLLLDGNKYNGWIADANYYQIDYTGTGLYDEDQIGVGIKKTFKLADWQSHVSINLDKSTYSGQDYQTKIRLEARGKSKLSKSERLILRYRYEDIASDNVIYDYLDGWRQKARVEYRQYDKLASTIFYYELELNDRANTLTTNFSPTRHTLRGKYGYKIDKQWKLTGDLSYRSSDYDATATQDRDDTRWKASVYGDYRLDKTLKIRTKAQYTTNDSSLAIYDYDKVVLSVSVSKLF